MIRVSGIPYYLCRHFRTVQDLDDVVYEERRPPENARLLLEGEVDVALIPTSEFASYGGYVGFDFGLSSLEKTESLYLCSNCPAEQLEKVYVYQGSSSSSLLFSLLQSEKWKSNPRLVKSRFKRSPKDIGSREGILARFEGPTHRIKGFEYTYDLGEEWFKLTGKPFVFLIWAARPGVLNAEQKRMLHDALHRGVKAGSKIAIANAEAFNSTPEEMEKFFENNFEFVFDEDILEALKTQLSLSAKHRLIPQTDYRNEGIRLVGKDSGRLKGRHEDEVLNALLNNHRISIQDAECLLKAETVSQLVAVASAKSIGVTPHASLRLRVKPSELEEILASRSLPADLNSFQLDRICIDSAECAEQLSYFENLIIRASKRFKTKIECFSTLELLKRIRNENRSICNSTGRLATCGLYSVGPDFETPYTQFTAYRYGTELEELLRIHKWLHSYNISTYCSVPGNPALSVRELVSHLHQLRRLQDFTRGAKWLVLEPNKDSEFSFDANFCQRSSVSSLFMDNVGSKAIYLSDTSELVSCIQLACFVSKIFIDSSLESLNANAKKRDFLTQFIESEISPRMHGQAASSLRS